MYCKFPVASGLPALCALLLLTACASSPGGSSIAYRDAETERDLSVPPDLTKPRSQTAASVPESEQVGGLLPEFDEVELVRAGANSWLELRGAPPERIWPRLKAFIRSEGLQIRAERPTAGIIETTWSERFDSLPEEGIGGFFNGFVEFFESSVGGNNVFDRFQFRLERMAGGQGSRVFVNHWSAQETRERTRSEEGPDVTGFDVQRQAGDPAIIGEMQRRLLVYVGVQERRASRIVERRSNGMPAVAEYEEIGEIGAVRLSGDDDFDALWSQVGDSLGQMGAIIDDADQERGVYRVRWLPPGEPVESGDSGGFFSGLFGGDDDGAGPVEMRRYVVQLRTDNGVARVFSAPAGAGIDPDATGVAGVPASGRDERALLQRVADAVNGTLVLDRPVFADQQRNRRESGGTRGSGSRGGSLSDAPRTGY